MSLTPEPSKEAEDIWQRALDTFSRKQAVAVIQEALAERDGRIAKLSETLANLANTINVVGSPYHKAQEALDQIVTDTKRTITTALKGRTDD